MPVAANNPVTVEGVNLEQTSFFDPILSSDSTMSCAKLPQSKTLSVIHQTLSPKEETEHWCKNTMALFNLAWYPRFLLGWQSIKIEQVFHPVREYNEMNLDWKVAAKRLEKNNFYKSNSKRFSELQKLTALISATQSHSSYGLWFPINQNTPSDRRKALFTRRGMKDLISKRPKQKGDCIHCHITDGDALGTTLVFSNNGLDAVTNPNDFKDKGRGEITGKKTSDKGKF